MLDGRKSIESFDSMPFDDLLVLRETIEEVISRRLKSEERELQARLTRIKRLKTEAIKQPAREVRKGGRGRKLEPKFRNPDDPSQTWAGRGLQPRWLSEALKSGRMLADFQISR